MNTIYKPVIGYEGVYEVSNTGVVRSVDRLDYGNRRRVQKERKSVFRGDYLCIGLYKEAKQLKHPIHRLVAIAFIPNPENKLFVNHINGIKTDNHVDNLEWCTSQENVHHSIRTGLSRFKKGSESVLYGLTGLSHYQARKVQCTITGSVMNFKEAALFLNIDPSWMSRIMNGKRKNWTNFIPL